MNNPLYNILVQIMDEVSARQIATEVTIEKIFACSSLIYWEIAALQGYNQIPGIDKVEYPHTLDGFIFYLDEGIEENTIIAFKNFEEYCEHINQQDGKRNVIIG